MMTEQSLGACGWCLDRYDLRRSVEIAAQELDLNRVQLGFFSAAAVLEADVDAILATAKAHTVQLVGVFLAFEGEDYASVEAIARTGGLAPDAVFAGRLELLRECARRTRDLGCPNLALQAGTVPSDVRSPTFAKLLSRVGEAADLARQMELELLLETGRESADILLRFIEALARPNVRVNLDPANFVAYGTDDPVRAAVALRERTAVVHLKDAKSPPRPGMLLGKPASLGSGDAQIARVLSKLRAGGYEGPLLIECDVQRFGLEVVRSAVDYVRSMLR
ncbi:MAG: sugar phosphate isomerase/epimerase family protein [Planctomycetota bacterium]